MQEDNVKKVRCGNCKNRNEDTTRCLIKKDKVRGNKRRFCLHYQLDVTKLVVRSKPVSRYAPIWEVDGAARRKRLKALTKLREAQLATAEVTTPKYSYLEDTTVTTPDCLAKIRSTAADPDEVVS
jgi:hypothetical protein